MIESDSPAYKAYKQQANERFAERLRDAREYDLILSRLFPERVPKVQG